MPDLTNKGYRYPLDSDPAADGAQSIRNLAADVNDNAGMLKSAVDSVHVVAGNDTGSVGILFAGVAFPSSPRVVATSAGPNFRARVGNVTAGGFTLYAQRMAGAGDADVDIHWIAHR